MMNYSRHKVILKTTLVTALSLMAVFTSKAQPKSVGASFSISRIGIVYEHDFPESASFLDVSVGAETAELFVGRKNYPGITASLTWNIIFKEWKSSEGNDIRLYAGPGASIGYSADFRDTDGVFFGLKGKIGGECVFARNAVISLSISPVIGSHLVSYPDHYTMKFYLNGIIYSLLPEIGLKYRF